MANRKPRVGWIDWVGSDRGTCGARCTRCNDNITNYAKKASKLKSLLECPSCHVRLENGGVGYASTGGSDY